MKIIIVDDDPIYRFTFERVLKKINADFEVRSFENGEDLLNHCHAEEMDCTSVDLILLDINMPVMDGWQFLEKFEPMYLANASLAAKLYIVSSSTNPVDVEHSKSFSSVAGYMVKPIAREKLKALVDSL
tara:strand:+ start:2515 stop:2901 length:387 start_codon:yes stop_codon:yes gene_type:complete